MKTRIVVSLLVMAVLLTGCFGSTNPPTNLPPVNKDSNVVIKIDWSNFESVARDNNTAMLALSSADDFQKVTRVGARLVYPSEGAAFTQSKQREAAEVEGVISMRVPPSSRAHLFVAAVREGEPHKKEDNLLVYTGVLRDIVISEETTLVIEMDEIDWSIPTWKIVDDEAWSAILSGEIEADRNLDTVAYELQVSDPFQWDQVNVGWDNLFISVESRAAHIGDVDPGSQKRTFIVYCNNPKVGVEGTSTCTASPRVKGEFFNLTSSRTGYYIEPFQHNFTILWR